MTWKKITFRKIYQRLNEGEAINAIIGYQCSPWVMRTNIITDFTADNQAYVSQYKKYLHIDLYFVVLQFSWLTKEIIHEGA